MMTYYISDDIYITIQVITDHNAGDTDYNSDDTYHNSDDNRLHFR